MKFLREHLVLVLFALVVSVSGQKETESDSVPVPVANTTTTNTEMEKEEGTNMCSKEEGCTCDTNVRPVPILCQGMDLHIMYEQSDWQATFDVLNLEDNFTLDVRFSENSLTTIPRFPPLPIVVLILRRNLISTIEDNAFSELKDLMVLDLSHNNLSGKALYEKAFFGQWNETGGYFPLPIQHLNISHNKIHSLNRKTFDHLTQLKTLDISHNPIKTLEGSSSMAIAELRYIQHLSLAFTQIASMHEGMLNDLIDLTSLDLSGNQFTTVPKELRFTHNLQVLSLDQNKFESLDKESFLGLELLEDLSLRNCEKLKSVEEGTFGGLSSLTMLDLSFCKRLETFSDGAFDGLVDKGNVSGWKLKDIRLNDNGLSQIDEVMAAWDYVDYIDIRNNPFRCDCNLEWMVKELLPKINRIKPALMDEINCAQPKAMRGKSITDLMAEPETFARCRDSKDELFPEEISLVPSSSYRAAGITVLVIGILLIVVGVSVIGVLILKRRAIARALVAHQEIRYERADSDDDGIGSLHSGKTRRGNNVF